MTKYRKKLKYFLMSSEGMQFGGTPSGRTFLHLRCKKKNPPRATQDAAECGKMRSPDIECKNKKRSYAGENDSQHIRALALGLDWHSSPRVTSYFTFYIAPGFAFSGIQRTLNARDWI